MRRLSCSKCTHAFVPMLMYVCTLCVCIMCICMLCECGLVCWLVFAVVVAAAVAAGHTAGGARTEGAGGDPWPGKSMLCAAHVHLCEQMQAGALRLPCCRSRYTRVNVRTQCVSCQHILDMHIDTSVHSVYEWMQYMACLYVCTGLCILVCGIKRWCLRASLPCQQLLRDVAFLGH